LAAEAELACSFEFSLEELFRPRCLRVVGLVSIGGYLPVKPFIPLVTITLCLKIGKVSTVSLMLLRVH
jgi:hypothetical protein